MTEDHKKTWQWTGGLIAIIAAILVALWLGGVFDTSAVQ